ncbi:flagellar radial spoke 5 [Olea europaea subsp. europaea]|uniref:Flagellar radial spoke 5 n=1 Tax=Olea europaea subsp. europaea TaxID=158383 RepID=A0A8S0UQH3_OLEEU|nr:flagellar radial spoke 5 [Olea europaea subsp. europaea]
MAAATMSVHRSMSNFYPFSKPRGGFERPRRVGHRVVRCCEVGVGVAETKTVVVKNGNDSLEICRVLNGMWQTSGGWGRIDRDDAVEAMFKYADTGLSTFDMADHCQFTFNSIKINPKCNRVIQSRKTFARPFQYVLIEDKKRVEVKNGKDSLDICRVVNGMWQTSGGWGRIDRDGAIYAMLQFAGAGLNTFDFADICKAHDNI